MRTAEDILNVIRERGARGLPLEDVYRQLFKPELYLRAYDRLYRNEGAMTKGTTPETVDGMSLEKIEAIIEQVRHERFRWTPVRRVEIPKAKQPGKTRPLGIPTWSDKLLQEVMRSLLEAYFEPQFSDQSHGFRPNRGCHTAFKAITGGWWGTKWFIEGDIKGCFDNIDHEVLLSILREKIQDNRFLRLVAALLKAGYLENWSYRPTLSGTPQGGVISPILANIYMDRLDQFVTQTLIPKWNRGTGRKENADYTRRAQLARYYRNVGNHDKAHQLKIEYQAMPSKDPMDPNYRRLRYVRYADDFLVGFIGSKAEAEEIKVELQAFLRDSLRLEMSNEKTLITHATESAARFLGYEIVVRHSDVKHSSAYTQKPGMRSINGKIGLRIPLRVIEERCALYRKDGEPTHRPELLNETDYGIIRLYQGEYRGFVQYYLLADNSSWLARVRWYTETSLLKTLAYKHKIKMTEVYRRYAGTIQTAYGPRKCFRATVERDGHKPLVAVFGGIPLRRQPTATIKDIPSDRFKSGRSELVTRLLAQECEVCGATKADGAIIEVHHLRKLSDLKKKGRQPKPEWAVMMSNRQRKTLVLCKRCHDEWHHGRLQVPPCTK